MNIKYFAWIKDITNKDDEMINEDHPKNIDELRALSNPKITYKGRVITGKDISKRGKMGDMKKNRPDTFYHNGPERYLKTTGAVIKNKQRENFCAKTTNRQTTRAYQGNASP